MPQELSLPEETEFCQGKTSKETDAFSEPVHCDDPRDRLLDEV